MRLPGDDLLPRTQIQRTMARNLSAPPAAVWPWIVQMGQERAGFYTYAALENLAGCRITNADEVRPQWQDVRVGDPVHLHPEFALHVAALEPPHALVLGTGPRHDERAGSRTPGDRAPSGAAFDFSWAFVLEPAAGGSRLLVRERYDCPSGAALAAVRAMRPVSGIMTHGMLRGVDHRSRGAVGPTG
jgi:hypothetical protein